MTKEELEKENAELKETTLCSDLCEHCSYIECGDFICDVNNDVTIVGWKPFPCSCPKKRSRK